MSNPRQSDVLKFTDSSGSLNQSASDSHATDSNLALLDEIYAELFHCQDSAELLQTLVATVVDQTLAESAYVAVFNSATGKLDLRYAGGAFDAQLLGSSYEYGEGLMGQVWESGVPLTIDDASTSVAIHTFSANTQVIAVPLMENSILVGVMAALVGAECDACLSSELAIFQRILNLTGIALSNINMLATTKIALQRMHVLVGTSRELNGAASVDEACQRVSEQLVEGLDVCQAGVSMFDKAGSVSSHTLCNSSKCSPHFEFKNDETVLNDLALQCLEKQGVVIANPEITGLDYYAFSVPLTHEDQCIGAVSMLRASDKPAIDSALLDTLKTITIQLSNTIERLRLARALRRQAFHDPLTELANRLNFETELQDSLDSGIPGALLFIDLDGFKSVNDTLGHGVGDQLLCHVAKRLENKLNKKDTLARMGGDEFAVILREMNDVETATACANRLLESLTKTFEIEKAQVKVGASIGLSQFPHDGDTVDTLLRNADMAMYEAKHNGKGCVLRFNKGTVDARLEVTQMHKDLHNALQQNQFELHFQPQISCHYNEVVGAEALLRWNHPEKGFIPPSEFISAAEQSGLINDVGEWVIDNVLLQMVQWKSNPSLNKLRIGINVAATQIQNPDFPQEFIKKITLHNIPASLVELEITESMVMKNVSDVVKRLQFLQDAGIRIAIDDFGTGYSSLSYLQDLPLDVLKIDQSFVQRLETENPDQSLANTIALLAVGLGLETVAEGVETLRQRDAITAMGCDLIQGHYYSKSLPADKLVDYIEASGFSGSTI